MTKTFDPAKPVQTRSGEAARIIATDAEGEYPIIALVMQKSGEVPYRMAADGRYVPGGAETAYDLVNVAPGPVRTVQEFTIYPIGDGPDGYRQHDLGINPFAAPQFGRGRAVPLRVTFEDDRPVFVELLA